MPIEVAGIKLNRVHKIVTLEQAAFVHHRIPGLVGNVVQDLGRDSVRLQIEGIFYGASAAKDLEALRNVYKKREAVDFLAEIVGQAYFGQVTLDSFEVFQLASEPEQFSYILTVSEYVKPPKPATAAGPSGVDQAIALEAQHFIAMATLPDTLALGQIPQLTNPAEPLMGALGEINTAAAGLTAVSEGIGTLTNLQVPTPEETVALPADWGAVPELNWGQPPELPADTGPAGQLFGPNGEVLGPDGRPLTTSVGGVAVAVDPQGQPLTGPHGELIGPDGQPIRDPSGWPIGADGQPIIAPWLALELRDVEGQPVAGARYVVSRGNQVLAEGRLDRQGRARIDGLEAEDYVVAFPDFAAEDWSPIETAVPVAEEPPAPTPGERPGVGAARTAWLAIELRDAQGQPVAGARYVVSRGAAVVREGTLDTQGRARIDELETGTYDVVFPDFDGNDWSSAGSDDATTGAEPSPQPPGDRPAPALDVTGPAPPPRTAEETSWLALELRDEDNQAVAGAWYVITLADGTTRAARLDDQGRAQIAGLPAGSYTITFPDFDAADWDRLTATRPVPLEEAEAISSRPEPGLQPDPGTQPPAIAAQTGWIALGLSDEDGQPLAGARYRISRGAEVIREGSLDAQGQARIADLEAGTYSLSFADVDGSDWSIAVNTF